MALKSLELGAGVHPTPNITTYHDRTKHSEHIQVAHDLDTLPWPFEDAEWDRVLALDVMEHLRLDVQEWLDEAWRILKPGGLLVLRLPAWDNSVSYRDPTHRKLYHPETFDYWSIDTQLHKDYGWFYFEESNRWWLLKNSERVNPGPEGVGDLGFVLQKVIK